MSSALAFMTVSARADVTIFDVRNEKSKVRESGPGSGCRLGESAAAWEEPKTPSSD